MTASVLQEIFADDAGGSGVTITSGALTSNATAGSTLEVWVTVSATATLPTTVTDSASQTYVNKKTVFNGATGNQQLSLYVLQNNASTAKLTFHATWSAAQSGKGIWIKEIGGVTSTAYDNAQEDIKQAPGTGTNAVAGTAITPTNAPVLCSVLVMECLIGNGSGLAAGTGYTLGTSGWTFGTANPLAKSESKILATVTSTNATMTDATNGGAGVYLIGLAMYDQASTNTFALTAQTSTSSEGTVTRGVSYALTGQSITSSEGTPTMAPSYAVTGQTVTSSEGTVTPSTTTALTGQTATFTEGTITASVGANFALTGQTATFSEGTISGAVSYALTGETATFTEGTITASTGNNPTFALTGQTATFSEGTISPAIAYAASGQTATFTEGAISKTGALSLTGQTATFTEGAMTGALALGLLGETATFSEGVITPVIPGPVTVALAGQTAFFTLGTVRVGSLAPPVLTNLQIPTADSGNITADTHYFRADGACVVNGGGTVIPVGTHKQPLSYGVVFNVRY